jgi:mannobiose 2-epimerase
MINLSDFRAQFFQKVTKNILPFYGRFAVDEQHGGFYGAIENNGSVRAEAPKGLVQHSRLLWTFAQAARQLQNDDYLPLAKQAYTLLMAHFLDKEEGGFFWFVDAVGQPLFMQKFTYGQAFAIYGLSEHFLATGNEVALETAVSLYHLLEKHARDPQYGGYFDVCLPDWTVTDQVNVDQVQEKVPKIMNTHLHLLEAYTNLLRAWNHPQLNDSLHALIHSMLDHIVDQRAGHLKLHFSENWRSLSATVSYGHDIEASWLLLKAAEGLGDEKLLAKVKPVAVHVAQVAYEEGLDADGSLRYEDHDTDKVWWAQAEAIVGFLNAYQMTGNTHFLDASLNCWQFVQDVLVDRQYGEWLGGVTAKGKPMPGEKAGSWKTPYHNGRCCLEMMRRVDQFVSMPDH